MEVTKKLVQKGDEKEVLCIFYIEIGKMRVKKKLKKLNKYRKWLQFGFALAFFFSFMTLS